jgi:pimeloyl-ACP methyl ester carboxylesterase
MLEDARFLSREGYSVLLIDFQAHGESPGKHITFGFLESRDAIAAVKFVREKLPEEKVGVIGISLGGAAAVLASPPLNVDAMVLETVYPTIEQAVSARLKMRFGPIAPLFTPLLTWQLKPHLGCEPADLRPVEKIKTLRMPKLFISGSEDKHTPLADARQLFDVAVGPKEFWTVEGATHTDLRQRAGKEYETKVSAFLSRCFAGEPPTR